MVVDGSLKPGQILAQSCHSAMHFMHEHYETVKHWMLQSDYIVILEVSNEDCLKKLLHKATELGIKTAVFREPDLDNKVTAVTFEPGRSSKRLLSNLPLALS